MRIVLKDFKFRGHRFTEFECELPNIKNLEEVTNDLISEYIIDCLDAHIAWQESFYVMED